MLQHGAHGRDVGGRARLGLMRSQGIQPLYGGFGLVDLL